MNFTALKHYLETAGQPSYRFTQIVSDIVSGRPESYDNVFTIPKSLRDQLAHDIPLITVNEKTMLISHDKKAYKALLALSDGECIETVLLNPKPELWSVCISCQVGCAMGCTFCATGSMGLKRNLTSEEICDQILFWRRYIAVHQLKVHISNIVYMGMGEPFANKENVFESIRALNEYYGLGQRHISVSTSGLIPGIEEFANTFPQVNLAISLHAPNDTLRNELMPINKAFPLDKLLAAIKWYVEKTNRQLFIEYLLLNQKNDQDSAAVELGNLLRDNFASAKHLIHVNLIIYNPTDSGYTPTPKDQVERFRNILEQFGISASLRKSLGQEIKGACGQLNAAVKE